MLIVLKSLVCQQVKAEHQRTVRFATTSCSRAKVRTYNYGLCHCVAEEPKGNNAIWVIMDRLTKSAHFIPFKVRQSIEVLTERYMQEVVRLHGDPISIASDRDMWFVSHFWKSLQSSLGTKLKFSTTYHPQTDGQSE